MWLRIFTFIIPLIIWGCHGRVQIDSSAERADSIDSMSFATGFSIREIDGFRIISVYDPWQNSSGVIYEYVLGKDPLKVPENLKELPFIQVPVEKVVILSTTHISYINALGALYTIQGVPQGRIVFNPEICRLLRNEDIGEVGYDQNLNYEVLVDLNPDVIFMFGIEGSIASTIEKLKDLTLVPVICGDYLESHPLGKVEWIKFFGEFYGCREKADSIYISIHDAYESILSRSNELDHKPLVLSGLPWKNTWYVPGGNSFAARLIEDAGGTYLWAEDSSSEALPLDLEAVYVRAIDAEIWINPGDASSLDAISMVESRFSGLAVYENGQVYNNNLRMNETGGNDYWEEGALRPDLILGDLLAIFHPDLAEDHQFIFYKRLK